MSATAKPSLERWASESMNEQPWNGIGEFAERKESDQHPVGGGEEGSNSGEVGSGAKSGAWLIGLLVRYQTWMDEEIFAGVITGDEIGCK